MKKILLSVLLTVSLISLCFGTSKTLPKGVWSFGLSQQSYNVSQVGGETFTAGTGNGDFEFRDIDQYSAKYISSFQSLVTNQLMSPDLVLANRAVISDTKVDIAYGVDEKLTLFCTIPYKDKVVEYTDDYINTMTALDAAAGLGQIPGATAENFVIPPKKARGRGINDVSVGAKYGFNDQFAMAIKYQGGPLKFGKDATEIDPAIDGWEELYVGRKSDYISIIGFYDFNVDPFTICITGGYEYSGEGWDKFFENDFKTNDGDVIFLIADSRIPITETISIQPRLIYSQAGTDQKYVNNEWAEIEGTAVESIIADLSIRYQPAVFMEAWLSYMKPIRNKVAGGIYDFPGRLNTDYLIAFGTTIYYK